ncbi:MAG: DNA topoisomerase [Planctomycetota bacterium]
MGKTLVITEKKSVADDFARVLSGGEGGKRKFAKHDLDYESDDMIVAWASGHLLELQEPGAYDKAWKYWSLEKLPIIPESFVHQPRGDDKKGKALLSNLTKLIRRDDVDQIVNGCDAGREGELIFNLIMDHALSKRPRAKAEKPVQRLWLQSMTADAIRASFRELAPSEEYAPLRNAAYARDRADWLVGMNGTRALTKRFLGGKNRISLAVGRVKTPTLAFLVDREREIDNFIPVPYWEIAATFSVKPDASGAAEKDLYESRWTGKGPDGKATDRILDHDRAKAVIEKIQGKVGVAEDTVRHSKEKPPQLFDLTSLQRRASSAFGFTLKRTLAITQTLYETKKAVTYPRTSSAYLPNDYRNEVPRIMSELARGGFADLVQFVPNRDRPDSERPGQVFDDKKVSDHFAIIPTGVVPTSLRPDEKKLYDLIVRRFLAAFMKSAERETVTRKTTVEGEVFRSTQRKLVVPGWRAVETIGADDQPFPDLAPDGRVGCRGSDLLEKATTPPSRFTDGTLVAEMETCGKHVESDEEAEALKDLGIGTPATRASIVEDLIFKRLARREGRSLVPTALGSTLVRAVRNMELGALGKPDLTGEWEKRLRLVTEGSFDVEEFDRGILADVRQMVETVKGAEDVSEIFALDYPEPLHCPKCGKRLIEKAYSYFCEDQETCNVVIYKDAGGKHVFPEILKRIIDAKGEAVGPFTGFERPRAPCKLRLNENFMIVVEPEGDFEVENPSVYQVEEVADGTVMGKCPKCQSEVKAEGTGFKCSSDSCNFRLSKKLLFRDLPPAEVKKMLTGPNVLTELIEGFISRRGRPFSAHLSFDEEEAAVEVPRAPEEGGGGEGREEEGQEEDDEEEGGQEDRREVEEDHQEEGRGQEARGRRRVRLIPSGISRPSRRLPRLRGRRRRFRGARSRSRASRCRRSRRASL